MESPPTELSERFPKLDVRAPARHRAQGTAAIPMRAGGRALVGKMRGVGLDDHEVS